MDKYLEKLIARIKRHDVKKIRKRASRTAAIIVVFCMVYGMILPAIAIDQSTASMMPGIAAVRASENAKKILDCRFEPHVHTDACYEEKPILDKDGNETGRKEKVLICGKSDQVVHEHDEDCYQDGQLVCTLPELKEHKHTEDCYEEQSVLVCTRGKEDGHKHTDACYKKKKVLVCGKQELHTHTADCYEKGPDGESPEEMGWVHFETDEDGDQVLVGDPHHLICGKTELLRHQHGDACFRIDETEPDAEASDADEENADIAADKAADEAADAEIEADKAADEAADADVAADKAADEAADADIEADKAVDEAADADIEADKAVDEAADAEIEADKAADEAADAEHPEEEGKDDSIDAETEAAAFTREIPVEGADYSLIITCPAGSGIPENATFRAAAIREEHEDFETCRGKAFASVDEEAIEENGHAEKMLGLFDLTIYGGDGSVIEPSAPVNVAIDFGQPVLENEEDGIYAVYFPGISILEDETGTPSGPDHGQDAGTPAGSDQKQNAGAVPDNKNLARSILKKLNQTGLFSGQAAIKNADTEVIRAAEESDGEVSFEAGGFSVYAIVYTVDFHWEVDGEVYEYSIKGGDTISLQELLPLLGVITDDPATDTDETEAFVRAIDTVSFSDESLVQPAAIDKDTTAGELKETLGLHPVYSENLTEEQIREMNRKELKSGDWVLVSLQAFETRESLTVTMKNGDVFTIFVTDAQDPNSIGGRTFSLVCQTNNKYSLTINSAGNGIQAKSTTVKNSGGSTVGDIYNTTETLLYSDTSDTAWISHYDTASGGYYLENNGRYLVFTGSGIGVVTDESQKQPVFITKNRSVTEASETDDEGKTTYTYTYGEWDGTYLISNKAPLVVDDESTGHQSAPSGLRYLQAGNGTFGQTDSAASAARLKITIPENPSSKSHKASMISATSIQSGQRLVIYQRVLQSSDTYKTYAIDGNGNMMEVKESSDAVYWVEDDPSLIWTVTEVLGSNGAPTGYYTLRNEKTGLYLTPKDAPGEAGSQSVHSLNDFGDADAKHLNISLPGAAGGQYTSTISCWDYDANVTYGLSVTGGTDRTGTAVPAALAVPELTESQAFYFAAVDPIVQDQLTTVDTVDSKSMGIKISMYDFSDSRIINYARQQYMSDIMGNDGWAQGSYTPGFLSRTLDNEGYPHIIKNGNQNIAPNQQKSLKELFEYQATSNNPKTTAVHDVNHLFLQSVYDESGFFKYSCFENFAQLNKTPNADGSTDFTVYEQVGVPWRDKNPNNPNDGNWEGRHDYYERGNFMPFDELTTANGHRSVTRDEDLNVLPDTDARKNEPLYYIKNVNNGNYYFGMIMEGSFTQKPGGLSDRGDPMVYEFNGDDDMWVYLDGVLVLDIGGVHDAFRGSINFRTGKVEVVGPQLTQGGTGGRQGETTWIKEQYYQAGKLPDGSDWPTRNGTKLRDDPRIDEFFTNDGVQDGKLVGTFRDYSTHDFKMFYMERGAGASNLELMFNLTLAPESGFRVKKEMPSTKQDQVVQTQYADAPFYYQAYIKDKNKDNTWHLYIPNENNNQAPFTSSAPYYETIVQKDNGSLETQKTDIVWKDEEQGIFVLTPGQTAFFPVREKGVEWYVKEIPAPGYADMLTHFDVTNTDPANYDPPYEENEAHRVSQNGTVTKSKTVTERGVVVFDNYPDESLVNELQITKRLKGSMYKDPKTASGLVEAAENNSPYFEYKVFLESTEGKMVPYALGPYYQKDKDGNYIYYEKGVRKHPETGSFHVDVPAGGSGDFAYKYTCQNRDSSKVMGWFGPIQHRNGTVTYEGYRVADGAGYIEYTYEPKITEHTSINGSLGDIRDGDTVIIKGLMVGTTFAVDERTDRSNMIKGLPDEDTDKKYLFEGTEVTGAYTGSTDDPDLQARIEASGTLYTNNPENAENVSYSTKAGKGVIIPDENAKVLVKNQGEKPFSLNLQKKWSADYDLTALDDDAKVIFTLKRYRIVDKSGIFTLKATVTGQPDYDPVYLIKDAAGDVIRTVTFSSMEQKSFDEGTKTDYREKRLKLPVGGPYTIEYGTGTTEDNTPYGYDVTNAPVVYGSGDGTYENITVTAVPQEEGEPVPDPEGIAAPDEATVSSTFVMHTGSLIIQKTMTGDVTLYGDFSAKYTITGAGLDNPIEIQTPAVSGGSGSGENPWLNGQWTGRVDGLRPGRYTVTEQVTADGPGLAEHKPSKRVVTVTKDGVETAAFEGEYRPNTVQVIVHSYYTNNGAVEAHRYESTAVPGTTIQVPFHIRGCPYYNGNYTYWTNQSDERKTLTYYVNWVGNNYRDMNTDPILVPSTGPLEVYIQSPCDRSEWAPTINDSNYHVVTNLNSRSLRRTMSAGISGADDQTGGEEPQTVNIGTAENPIRNTVTPPSCNAETQYVVPDDSWSLEVALSNSITAGGKKTEHVVTASGTVEDTPVSANLPESFEVDLTHRTWTANIDVLTLADLNLPVLAEEDEDGNLYYYYIYAVREEKVPQGTSVSIDKNGDKTLYVGGKDNTTPLSVTNELVSGGELQLTKAVTINDDEPATEAGKALTTGTYEFTIAGISGTDTENESHAVKISFENGKAVSYQIDQNAVVEVTGTDNTWTVTVPNLPVGDYTITETNSGNLLLKTVTGGKGDGSASSKTVTVTVEEGSGAAAAAQAVFTNNMNTVDAEVLKVWKDKNGNPLTSDLPEKLTVNLVSETTVPDEEGGGTHKVHAVVRTTDLTAAGQWKASYTDLPVKDAAGNNITYFWSEETLQGFFMESNTTVGKLTTITNKKSEKYEPKKDYTGTKKWTDLGGTRPDLTITLYATITPEDESSYAAVKDPEDPTRNMPFTWTSQTGNTWTYVFSDLPVFDANGNVIYYKAVETEPENYSGTASVTTTAYTHVTPDITRITSCNQLNHTVPVINLTHETDLAFVAIKKGNQSWVWTPRKATPAEETLIKSLVNDGTQGMDISNADFKSGMPYTLSAGNGTVSFAMGGNEGKIVNMTFSQPQVWSMFCYGSYEDDYTQGRADFENKLVKAPFAFEKQWKGEQGSAQAWVDGIAVTLSRSYEDDAHEVHRETLGEYTISHVPAEGAAAECYTVKKGSDTVTLVKDGAANTFRADPEALPEGWSGPVELTVAAGPVYDFTTGSLPMYLTVGEGTPESKTYAYTYTVAESGMPEGYTAAYAKKGQDVTPGLDYTDNGGTIINRTFSGAELPSTGGCGTGWIYLAGIMMLLSGGLGLVMKRRRRLF